MKKHNKHKKGFTLMEILVATAIFAVVMVIATGVIAQGSAYNGKIKAMRESSEETRRLADMITRDIKSANAKIDYSAAYPVLPDRTLIFKNGVFISNYGSSPNYTDTPSGPVSSSWEGTAIVIGFTDSSGVTKYKCYVSENGKIYYKETNDILQFQPATLTVDDSYVISNPNLYVGIIFGGYTPKDLAVNKQQPYVQFDIKAETKNYSLLLKSNRAQAEIKSTVTVRSYNE